MGKAQAQRQGRFRIVEPNPSPPQDTGGGGPMGPDQATVSEQLRQVRLELKTVIADLKDKKVTPGVGAVQVQALNAILRALSEERKVVTEEEVERRVALIEEQVRR